MEKSVVQDHCCGALGMEQMLTKLPRPRLHGKRWELVGGGVGLSVPQLWETPADSDLVVGTVNICNAAHYQQPIRFKASDCPHPLNVLNVKEGGLQGSGRLLPPSPAGAW